MTWLHALVDVPEHLLDPTAEFWSRALGWAAAGPLDGHPELRSFAPAAGASYAHLQAVDDAPRVHLDLETDDQHALAERAVGLGAQVVASYDEWRTLRSPGGLLFCTIPIAEHDAPGPVTWPGGHRSQLTQVCVDSPASAYEREVEFWRGLLDGDWGSSTGREYDGPLHVEGSPLQLLFQRRDDDHGPVRCHLDLAADDRDAEVRRLLAAGAEDVGPGRSWHVLRDPAGLPLCVTGQPLG